MKCRSSLPFCGLDVFGSLSRGFHIFYLSVLMCHQLYPSSNAQKSWNQLHWCCSPSLIWHVWSCKKVSYYPNVVFSMIRHFGLTCCITKVFQENGLFWCESHFVYTMKIYMSERTFYSEEICLQRHTIWSSKSVRFHHNVFYHIIRYEVRTATPCVYELLHWYVQSGCPMLIYQHTTLY